MSDSMFTYEQLKDITPNGDICLLNGVVVTLEIAEVLRQSDDLKYLVPSDTL